MIFPGIKNEKEAERPVGLSQAVRRRRQKEIACKGRRCSVNVRSRSVMIKDIVVNLGLRRARPGRRFCHFGGGNISMRTCWASPSPTIRSFPGTVMGGIPAEFIESQRADIRKARAPTRSPASSRPPSAPASPTKAVIAQREHRRRRRPARPWRGASISPSSASPSAKNRRPTK